MSENDQTAQRGMFHIQKGSFSRFSNFTGGEEHLPHFVSKQAKKPFPEESILCSHGWCTFFQGKDLEEDICQALNYTVLLLRNVLFLPEPLDRDVHEPDIHICILRYDHKQELSNNTFM